MVPSPSPQVSRVRWCGALRVLLISFFVTPACCPPRAREGGAGGWTFGASASSSGQPTPFSPPLWGEVQRRATAVFFGCPLCASWWRPRAKAGRHETNGQLAGAPRPHGGAPRAKLRGGDRAPIRLVAASRGAPAGPRPRCVYLARWLGCRHPHPAVLRRSTTHPPPPIASCRGVVWRGVA